MLTKFKDFSIHSYFVLPLRAYNLTTVTYLITDNIQQINKISSLVYNLDLLQLFIFLVSSFQYVLIYATVFFMLQVKFGLKYKRTLASALNNSLWNLKIRSIFFKREEKQMKLVLLEEEMCVRTFMTYMIPSCRVIGRDLATVMGSYALSLCRGPHWQTVRFRNTVSENGCDLSSLSVWLYFSWPLSITKGRSLLSC